MREVIKTGKTVDEATALALAELGLAEEEVTIEVLELPQKRFFKSIPAKVRLTVDAEEDEALAAASAAAKPAHTPAPAQPKAPKAAAPKTAPQPAAPKAAPAQAAPAVQEPALAPVVLESNEKVRDAVEYLSDLCAKMGTAAVTVSAFHQGEAVVLKVEGEDAGSLIGHRGEVMEALSYLTGLVANRSGGDYVKINLDINHYRSKREANLTTLAKRIGAKVAKTGRNHTLEPMNPYERRIIHSAISEMENVKSQSTGEGANRRVVILCTGENARGDRPFRQAGRGPRPGVRDGARDGTRGGDNRSRAPHSAPRTGTPGRFGDGAPKSNVPTREFADRPRDTDAAPTVPQRTETVNDSTDLPLYGKIEL